VRKRGALTSVHSAG